MPRPRNSRKGGRVTPKGTRHERRDCGGRARPRLTPEEVLLRDAAENFGECDGVDEAETTASSMLVMFRPLRSDEGPILDASRVLTAAQVHTDRTAAAEVAAALGAYGPPGQRRRARGLAARLIASGAPVPVWIGALGDVEPRRAVVMADGWDEERILWIDFERPDGEVRGIGMRVNAMEAGYACGFLYGPAIDEVSAAVETKSLATARDISLADARAMAVWGLALRDACAYGHDHHDEDDELGADPVDDEVLRALVGQRVDLLPTGGAPPFDGPLTEDEFDDLCDEFLGSRWLSAAAGEWSDAGEEWSDAGEEWSDAGEWSDAAVWSEADETRWLAHWLVNNVCQFAEHWCDADPLRWSPARVGLFLASPRPTRPPPPAPRWSPARVGLFLEVWIPERVVCHDGVHDAVEAAFPRWLRFAAERRGLAEELAEENLAAARESFSAMRANSADPSKRSELTNYFTEVVNGVANLEAPAAVQAWFDDYDARAASNTVSESRRLILDPVAGAGP